MYNELIDALRKILMYQDYEKRNICHDAADAIEHLKEIVAHQQDEIDRKDKAIERMRNLMRHYKAAYRTACKLYQEARNEQQP